MGSIISPLNEMILHEGYIHKDEGHVPFREKKYLCINFVTLKKWKCTHL